MPLFHFRWATIYLFQTLLFQSSSQCLEIPVEVALRGWVLTLTLCLAPRLTLAVRGIQHLSCKMSDSYRIPSFLPSICFVLCVLSSCPFGSTSCFRPVPGIITAWTSAGLCIYCLTLSAPQSSSHLPCPSVCSSEAHLWLSPPGSSPDESLASQRPFST